MISKSLLLFLVVHFVSDYSHGQKEKKFFRKDYRFLEASEGFYKFQTVQTTWAEAKKLCNLEGASLFYPQNDDEAQAVIAYWNWKNNPFDWVFIGISDLVVKGIFATIDGKSISDVYNNWSPGEPNNADGVEDCVIFRKDGTLNDDRCFNKYPFICKKRLQALEWNKECNMPDLEYKFIKELGRCYKFHFTPLSWTDAYAACFAEKSYLAVINSQSEADALVRLTGTSISSSKDKVNGNFITGAVLLGFHDRTNDGWQTITGTTLRDSGYSVWGNNQPDGGDRKKCGSMFYSGRLNDVDCAAKTFFICEHEIESR